MFCSLEPLSDLDFQVRTNLLRKTYSYDKQRIEEDNLPLPLKAMLSLYDLTANVSLSLSLFAVVFFMALFRRIFTEIAC